MMMPRLLMAVVAGAAAMAGLVGSVAPPVPARVPRTPVSTVEIAAPRWIGGPVAQAQVAVRQQIEQQQREVALTARLAQIDGGSVDLAVAVLDRRAGSTYSYAATKQFRTASIVKVDILATLLLQANRAGRSLTSAERSLAAAMIKSSDNDAASALWRRTGGISATMSTFGLTSTRQGSDGDWGETMTTAEDRLRLLAQLADPAGAVPGGSYVLDLMSAVVSDQDWGVSAAAHAGERTALKNGWYPVSGGWILNSVGRITDADSDLLIVVLSRGHSSYATGIRTVEQVAALVRETVGG
jgi:beta-lactamase class A